MAKSKYSIDFKIQVVNEGHFKNYCEQRRLLLYKQNKEKKKTIEIDSDTGEIFIYNEYPQLIKDWENANKNNPYFDCSKRLFKSIHDRLARIRKKVFHIIESNQAYFLTLTFSNEVLANTTPEERREKVSRFLKKHSSYYVANIDFGSEREYVDKNSVKIANKREHYHAIINRPIFRNQWPLGESHCMRIYNTRLDLIRTTKYIAKLSLESLKANRKMISIIYSKEK